MKLRQISEGLGVTSYANGRDPEEFGWVFNDTGSQVDAYTLAYETPDRATAAAHGVSQSVLARYEQSGYLTADYGSGLVDWLQDNVQISEGLFDRLLKRKPESTQEPEPQRPQQPAKKGFQFSQQDFQNADAFVNTILRQINSVLGPAYIGRLNQMRGGIPSFKKALRHFWGRAAGSFTANLQDAGSQNDLTPQIAKIADSVMQSA